jgi:hypothetical protein
MEFPIPARLAEHSVDRGGWPYDLVPVARALARWSSSAGADGGADDREHPRAWINRGR